MIYDCFFSYQHDDLNLVEALANKLEAKGLKCWYAPRNISGKYAKAIAEGISHSKVFLLVLNHRSATSEEVLNEIELAHNVAKQSTYAAIQPLLTEELNLDSPDYGEVMYYIRRFQFINAAGGISHDNLADAIIQSQPHLKQTAVQRTDSKYIVQQIEDERLKIQNHLLNSFDADIYKSVFDRYENPAVFDVGCGTGTMMLSKIDGFNVSLYLGIDKSERQISIAEKNKPDKQNIHFFELDVEAESFSEALDTLLKKLGINGFEIINISMVLLHLNEPANLLAKLKSCLSDDGTVIIRDIDDGLNFAYPDSTNAFERIYKMCDYDEQSGNRRNGRQVYCDLKKAGFTRIKLERQGLSSIGMDEKEKEAFFQMYFPFIKDNAKTMAEKNPDNLDYQENSIWYEANYDNIHALFLQPDFNFSLGFMTFTAQK